MGGLRGEAERPLTAAAPQRGEAIIDSVETPRRREIDDVASSLFREHGYSGTSVRDIARALDIQGASLYAHVTSKQDVLWSIVERTATRFELAADAATASTAEAGGGDGSPAVVLAALVRAHIRVVTDDVERASVFTHEWRALTGERRAQIARRRDAYERRFRAVIEDGVTDGSFGPIDPLLAAAFVLTSLNGICTWYRPDGPIAPTALADSYADYALGLVGVVPGALEPAR